MKSRPTPARARVTRDSARTSPVAAANGPPPSPKRENAMADVEMVTYRRVDGEAIAGEYDFVTQLEWFETDYEPTDLLKQTWRLVSEEEITVGSAPDPPTEGE